MDKKTLKLGGKYKMGKKLGAGAFGEVYLGKILFHSAFLAVLLTRLSPLFCHL